MQKDIHRPLSSAEMKCCEYMSLMIEAGGGQIEEGIYVTAPGVMLLSTGSNLGMMADVIVRSALHATFLLSGVSVETCLEFIAHSESSVARLTTSKTAAMNVPFYRVQGRDERGLTQCLQLIQNARSSFEVRLNPRTTWEDGTELFNMTAAGCKATAFAYTMKIVDFHKLFIGRMGASGNEKEVRDVARRMANMLHKLYPSIILSADEYLSISNGAKYTPPPESMIAADVDPSCDPESGHLISHTTITSEARDLFRRLHIDVTEIDVMQLSEFRSKITYLSFAPKKISGREYMHKMIHEYQHLSVVTACINTVALHFSRDTAPQRDRLLALCLNVCGQGACEVVHTSDGSILMISVNLKCYHRLLKELAIVTDLHLYARRICDCLHGPFSFVIGSASDYKLMN